MAPAATPRRHLADTPGARALTPDQAAYVGRLTGLLGRHDAAEVRLRRAVAETTARTPGPRADALAVPALGDDVRRRLAAS